MSRDSYPELPAMPEKITDIPAKLLGELISKTIFSISAEESRFTLNGALLALTGSSLTMVATDGHRLAMIQRNVELAGLKSNLKAQLPKKAMQEVQRLVADAGPDDTVAFAGDENHLFFESGERLLISRKLTGNFPDYERVLPKDQPNRVSVDREAFKSAIERVAQFSDDRSHAIRLQVGDGEVKVHSSLSDTGESEDSILVDYNGPALEIGFNAAYLIDFLRGISESEASFHFKDSNSAGELRPAGEGVDYTYRYVVMPMRI
jgi:DNA polymerase-3 subunit beta